mmetsp:Transcript_18651/g.28177  ORF Transcript_18651/g.28177 Transcript_18651/m.28177 type:complete len:247 (+) Transcript_18651:61-801(+)
MVVFRPFERVRLRQAVKSSVLGVITVASSLLLSHFILSKIAQRRSSLRGEKKHHYDDRNGLSHRKNESVVLKKVKSRLDLDDVEFVPKENVRAQMLELFSSKDFQESVPLVLQTWQKLKPNYLQPAMGNMYDHYRQSDTIAAAIFDENIDWQRQRIMFGAMLGTLMASCSDPEALVSKVLPLGSKHGDFKVKPINYDNMRKSLVHALKAILAVRHQWNAEYEWAWNCFFRTICQGMILASDCMLVH